MKKINLLATTFVLLSLTLAACKPASKESSHIDSNTDSITESTEDVVISSIRMKTLPSKVLYDYGEELVVDGGVLEITKSDNSKEDVNLTLDMVSGYDSHQVREQTLTVTYEQKTTSFNVTVQDVVESISLADKEYKTDYEYDEELDLTNVFLDVEMKSGATQEVQVTSDMVSGYDKRKIETQVLTISYRGKTTGLVVTVHDVVLGIAVSSTNHKVKYYVGDQIDLTNLKINVTYKSGASAEVDVTSSMVSGFNSSAPADAQIITISYANKQTTFTVKIVSALYVLPEGTRTVEDLLTLNVGETMGLTLRSGVAVNSSDPAVASIGNDGLITALSWGTTKITVSDNDFGDSKSFMLVVRKTYEGKTIVTQDDMSTVQGTNNLYVYKYSNGDIENDLAAGLANLTLHDQTNDAGYWDGVSFIGRDHFGGSGTGALSFRAKYDGNYTIDYAAWLDTGIRKNPEYMTWDVDGFSTGIAKKATNGTITVLVSNVGDKPSVVNDETRYQMGSVTLDLEAGEEIMMFFCSNGSGAADEVFTDIIFTTNSTIIPPLYSLPASVNYVEDLLTLNVGESYDLTLRSGATIVSSNTDVATVTSAGKINAVGYGKAIITVADASLSEEESIVLIVRKTYEGKTIVTQDDMSTVQGTNNLYVYKYSNGDIENDLAAGLANLTLHDQTNDAGYWDGVSFIGRDHFGGSGTGALSFRAKYDGNYTIDYAAWLDTGIRKNPEYMTWDVDGFSTGIAKKATNGTITVLVSNVGDKPSVVNDETRYQMGSVTLDLEAGEEIMMFFCSNGSGAADEVFTDIIFTTNSINS